MTRTEEFVQIAKCLEYLEEAGWSEMIDSRFEEDVVRELTTKYPDMPKHIIDYVLNLVLV
jgi:hypothetical protein